MDEIIENSTMPEDSNGVDEQYDVVTPEVQPNKRRRKKSEVWQYFTTQPISEDCTRACCNQCNRSFAYINGKKQSGTSHLRRHIINGVCRICPPKHVGQETEQLFPYSPGSQKGAITAPPRKRCRASPGATPGSVTFALDQESCTHEIAKMIIRHEYPTSMAQQPGFIDFARSLQPQFPIASFNSVQSEIVTIYRREKHSLANILAGIPSRVSLTMDFWTTDQTVGYAMLTGHFIDADWRLQRRVLNFLMVPFPDSELAFNHAIATCLSEWSLESKLFALTLDQSFANDAVVGNNKSLLSISNSSILNGQFLMVTCYARVISRLAQEALAAMREVVGKVRDSVKFVKASESREEKFKELRKRLRIPCTENLVIDNREKWDSTYHMLSTACDLHEVFTYFDTSDPDYKLAPSMEDWKRIKTLCTCLKLFFDASNVLTAKTYPAANVLYHEVCKIFFGLNLEGQTNDPVVCDFVRPLSEKLGIYCRDCGVVLAMAVVMDPRYKFTLLQWSLGSEEVYGENWVKTVDESMHELYYEYVAQTLSIQVEQRYDGFIKAESPQDEAALTSGYGISDYDEVYISEISSNNYTKWELDQYLGEALLPRGEELDIFEWWKLNRIKYPTLSKMAADLLSIPFATVHRDSVFDTTTRKLDSYRCSLKPDILEAVVCANDWLQFGSHQSSTMFDMISPLIENKENKLSVDNFLDCADAKGV